jgi:hypothetical protein
MYGVDIALVERIPRVEILLILVDIRDFQFSAKVLIMFIDIIDHGIIAFGVQPYRGIHPLRISAEPVKPVGLF